MESILQNTLYLLECHDIARCEAVCKSWSTIVNQNHAWRSLCIYYFSPLPGLRKALKDKDWENLKCIKLDPIKHKRPLNMYDYLEYFESNSTHPWKRWFLLFTFMFDKGYHQCNDNIDTNISKEHKQTFKDNKKKLFLAKQIPETISNDEIFLVGKFVADKMVKKLTSETTFVELLEPIFENYYICDKLTNKEGMDGPIETFCNAIAPHLVALKNQRGYKITKDSQDSFSLFVSNVLMSNLRSIQPFISLLEKSFVLDTANQICKKTAPLYQHQQWDMEELTRGLFAYIGSPSKLLPTLEYDYISDYEIKIFEDEKKGGKWMVEETEYERESSSYFLCKTMGLSSMLSEILKKEVQNDKTLSAHIVQDLESVLEGHFEDFVKCWALSVVVTNKEFYEFWQRDSTTKIAVTNFLINGLVGKRDWEIHRMAQRMIVKLATLRELDLGIFRSRLNAIIDAKENREDNIVSRLALLKGSDVSWGEEGDIFCWVLFVLLQVELGDKQKYIDLGRKLFIQVPNLSDDVRNSILLYFAGFVRPQMHPRWLIESSIKGIKFCDTKMPHWIEKSEDIVPQVEACRQLQDKILQAIGSSLRHRGFSHCTSSAVALFPYGIGVYYALLLAPSSSGAIDLFLSEVGPYAMLQPSDPQFYISHFITTQEKHDMTAEEMINFLSTILQDCGVKIISEPELSVNLTDFQFCCELGPTAMQRNRRHTINNLLFGFSD